MHSAIETPEFLLVFFNRLGAYYVPKRLIPMAELDSLRALLLAKLGHRARVVQAPAIRAT